MAKNEKTSKDIASIAAKGLKNPGALTKEEIQKLAGAALTQTADKPKVAPKPKPAKQAKPKPAAKPPSAKPTADSPKSKKK